MPPILPLVFYHGRKQWNIAPNFGALIEWGDSVGLARYVEYRQRDEIRALLEAEGISLSTGTISGLARTFLAYLERLHLARADRLRAALEADGGWPMHVDATG